MCSSPAYPSELIGLASLPLSQKRYKKGSLFISLVRASEKLIAYDIRYFYEDTNCVYPTRYGFRIPADCVKNFTDALDMVPVSGLNRIVIVKGSGRTLLANYCNDEYGEGIDVRYYLETPKYSGWDRRGIRFVTSDWVQLRRKFRNIDIDNPGTNSTNLFVNRPIKKYVKTSKATRASGRATRGGAQQETKSIHEDIIRLLDSL